MVGAGEFRRSANAADAEREPKVARRFTARWSTSGTRQRNNEKRDVSPKTRNGFRRVAPCSSRRVLELISGCYKYDGSGTCRVWNARGLLTLIPTELRLRRKSLLAGIRSYGVMFATVLHTKGWCRRRARQTRSPDLYSRVQMGIRTSQH